MKLNAVLTIALATGFGLVSITAAMAKGYKTPEHAIAAYIEGVAAQDLDKVLAATAIDKMSAEFDFIAYVDRLRSLTMVAPAPAGEPMFEAINKAAFTAQISRQVLFLTYGLLTTSELVQGKTVLMDAAGAAAFENEADPARLEGLTLSKVGLPMASMMSDERYLTNAASQAATYGADELTERVALLTLDGASYLIGFTLLRYGRDWGVSNQTSALAGTSSSGAPEPITPEEFDQRPQ